MRCEQIEERLEAYVDGELLADDTLAINSHLEACRLCRQNLESRLEIQRIFREEIKVQAPDYLQDRILKVAAASGADDRVLSSTKGHAFGRWLGAGRPLALATAAALAVILIGPRLLEKDQDESSLEAFSQPSRVVVLRYGERPGQTTPVKFGGIVLTGITERRSQ